jgi:hypothetical protein
MLPDVTQKDARSLKANRRMAFYLMAFLLVLFIMAGMTFPFVDHVSRLQNILYGLVVTSPFIIVNIVFIVLTGRDLKSSGNQP